MMRVTDHRADSREPHPPRGNSFPGQLRATQAERDQVAARLGDAFAEGCLDEAEFEARLEAAMTARTRGELAPLLADVPDEAMNLPPAGPRGLGANDRTWAALTHASGLLTGFFGPLVSYLVALMSGSAFVRKEAAESLNFQLTFFVANFALVLAAIPTFGLVVFVYPFAFPVLWIAWFVLTLVGAVTATGGKPYSYPANLRMIR